MTDATYTGGDGEQYDRKTNRLVPGTGDPNAPPPQSTLPPGQGGAGASALGPQSPLQARFMKGMDKLDALQADEEKQFKASEAASQPLRDREMKELMTPVQARSHLEKLKDAPKPEDYQKGSMEFASSMALVGAVFGRFSRRGGTAALNAFSGALKGWHEGNMEAYGNAQKEWEANTKKTLENNQMEIEKYKEIIENKKLNIDQMAAGLTLAAQPFQNKLMFDYAQEKNINGALNLYDKMTAIQERATKSAETMLGFNRDNIDEVKQAVDIYNENPGLFSNQSPSKQAQIRIAAERFGFKIKDQPNALPPGWTDEQLNYQADLYNKTGQIPSYGFGKDATAIRSAITKRAADRAQSGGQTPGDLVANRADIKSLGQTLSVLQKQKAAVDAFENTAIANGKVLEKLADKVDSSGSPVVLRWLRAGQREIAGDADVNNFHAQMQLYRNEVAKIMTNPNMTGVLTDTARREGEQFLSGDISASMLHSLIPLLNADMGRRKASIDNEIQSVKEQMGASPKAGGGAAAPAAPGAPPVGTVEDGHRFKGGDPSDQSNWEPVS